MTLWVVKIGTSLLRGSKSRTTSEIIDEFCTSIAQRKALGDEIILVSSGAVGLGCSRLEVSRRPEDVASLQAAAAIGQVQLMTFYKSSMGKQGYNVAQVLLTRSDLGSRDSYQNASKTLKKLLEWNVLPIVNENDTISSEELKNGDNDTLSALVATAVSADQLILLTDVDKLYSKDPRLDSEAKPIDDVHHPKELQSIEEESIKLSSWGTGGISTKLSAARIATASGITVQLADGRNPKSLFDLLNGGRGGTVFHPSLKPLANKKSWLAHAIKPLGSIQLDEGASEAVLKRGASLLLVGVNGIQGDFLANQPVRIINSSGKEIARGITSLTSEVLKDSLRNPLNSKRSQIVIHRDVLVLTEDTAIYSKNS